MRRNAVLVLVMFLSVSLNSGEVLSQGSPLSGAEGEILVAKNFNLDDVAYYKKPVKITPIKKGSYKFDTPKNAFIAYVSTLKGDDLDDLSVYDSSTMVRLNTSLKDPKYRKRITEGRKKLYGGTECLLLRKIEFKGAVVFEHKFTHKDGSGHKTIAAFIKEGGKWKYTGSFSNDPDYNKLWNTLTKVIESNKG